MTNNRDMRDDVRDKRDYDTKHKDDMSWLFPALIGLLVLGAIAYYFMRNRMPTVEKALPVAAATVADAAHRMAVEPAAPKAPATPRPVTTPAGMVK